MKKVLAYDKLEFLKKKILKKDTNWKNAGGFFKYYDLEQYEDVLKNMRYKDNTPTDLFDTKSFWTIHSLADEKICTCIKK